MVKDNGLRFSYDKSADVLYVSVGRPKKCLGEMTDNGIIIRTDPKDSNKILGLTILDFQERFSQPHSKPLPVDISAKLQPA